MLPKLIDFLFQLLGHFKAVSFWGISTAVLVPVRLTNMRDIRDRQAALGMHRRHAAQTCTGHRAAMISILSADDDLFIGLSQ